MSKKRSTKKKVRNARTDHKTSPIRLWVRSMGFLLLGISVGAILTLTIHPYVPMTTFAKEEKHMDALSEDVPQALQDGFRALPVSLTIPRIGLFAPFGDPLGQNPDKSVEVPRSYNEVGWYKFGALPGERGTAVVLGHVDSYRGPAIFYSLSKMRVGDVIDIERDDNTVVSYRVTNIRQYAQDSTFPNEEVFSATEGSELRLITCTGTFDHFTRRYSHNLVVYATLANTQSE